MKHYFFVIVNALTCICDYCKNSTSKEQCLALLKYDVKMFGKLVELIKNKPSKEKK